MRDDTPEFDRPPADCVHHLPGTPEALPMPNGWICGGIDKQPCHRCKRYALGHRGQAEFFAETMGYQPKGD